MIKKNFCIPVQIRVRNKLSDSDQQKLSYRYSFASDPQCCITYLSLEPGSTVDLVQLVQQGRDGTGKVAVVGQAAAVLAVPP
jgi:hypothetical protein